MHVNISVLPQKIAEQKVFETHHDKFALVVVVFDGWQCVLLEEGNALGDGRLVVVNPPFVLTSLAQPLLTQGFLAVQQEHQAHPANLKHIMQNTGYQTTA